MGRSWRSNWRPIDLIRLTLLIVTLCFGAVTQAAEPIKIGMSMALTGPLAGTGKAALLGTQIWVEDINAKGGILGRPIQLIYYDDQSNPSLVPGIYTKLIDVDKVDLVTSGYATNMVAPAMPIAMGHGLVFVGLYALDVNAQFNYDRYFSIVPQGTEARLEFSRGFYQVALSMDPKPATVAIVGADAEYAHIATDGARENAQKLGLKILYDRTYPPNTVDFVPIVRAIQASSPDLVFLASYPLDSAGMVRAVNEVGLKTKMFGGGMVGLQYAALKQQLGPYSTAPRFPENDIPVAVRETVFGRYAFCLPDGEVARGAERVAQRPDDLDPRVKAVLHDYAAVAIAMRDWHTR
jgi:branched-chain amino acid transport system substrate-binding protein